MQASELQVGHSVLLKHNELKWDRSAGLAVIVRLDNSNCILVRYTENLNDPIKTEKSVEIWTTWKRFAGIEQSEPVSIARQ